MFFYCDMFYYSGHRSSGWTHFQGIYFENSDKIWPCLLMTYLTVIHVCWLCRQWGVIRILWTQLCITIVTQHARHGLSIKYRYRHMLMIKHYKGGGIFTVPVYDLQKSSARRNIFANYLTLGYSVFGMPKLPKLYSNHQISKWQVAHAPGMPGTFTPPPT